MGNIWDKPIRWIFKGDEAKSLSMTGEGKRVLFQLKNIQSAGSDQFMLNKRYSDGSSVNVRTDVQGMDIVRINTPIVVIKGVEKQEEKYVIAHYDTDYYEDTTYLWLYKDNKMVKWSDEEQYKKKVFNNEFSIWGQTGNKMALHKSGLIACVEPAWSTQIVYIKLSKDWGKTFTEKQAIVTTYDLPMVDVEIDKNGYVYVGVSDAYMDQGGHNIYKSNERGIAWDIDKGMTFTLLESSSPTGDEYNEDFDISIYGTNTAYTTEGSAGIYVYSNGSVTRLGDAFPDLGATPIPVGIYNYYFNKPAIALNENAYCVMCDKDNAEIKSATPFEVDPPGHYHVYCPFDSNEFSWDSYWTTWNPVSSDCGHAYDYPEPPNNSLFRKSLNKTVILRNGIEVWDTGAGAEDNSYLISEDYSKKQFEVRNSGNRWITAPKRMNSAGMRASFGNVVGVLLSTNDGYGWSVVPVGEENDRCIVEGSNPWEIWQQSCDLVGTKVACSHVEWYSEKMKLYKGTISGNSIVWKKIYEENFGNFYFPSTRIVKLDSEYKEVI